jgi:histidyl-tRNA synthetase
MSSFLSTQGYKGTRDFYPEDMRLRRWMFGKMQETARLFGYEEYDGPVIESFELYAAKSGEELVNEQLYHFTDRGDRKVAIRPEMTPTMARLVAAKFHELTKPIRLFSIPNLWRYEKPQKGRLREHWQLNVDVLGGDSLLADAEVLTFAYELMRAYGGEKFLSFRINNRHLMDQFFSGLGLGAEDALKVSKAIDAKAKITPEKFTSWLKDIGLQDAQISQVNAFFEQDSATVAKQYPGRGADELTQLFSYLHESGMKDQVVFDPTIMRGLNYYTGTVFEIYDISPENRRAMFGGGRYDNLLGLFGKNQLSGVGFGMGDVTLMDFLSHHKLLPELSSPVEVFVALPSAEFRGAAETLSRNLRAVGCSVVSPLEYAGFGVQLKQALKKGAKFAVLFGEEEWKSQKVLVKNLVKNQQESMHLSEVCAFIQRGV